MVIRKRLIVTCYVHCLSCFLLSPAEWRRFGIWTPNACVWGGCNCVCFFWLPSCDHIMFLSCGFHWPAKGQRVVALYFGPLKDLYGPQEHTNTGANSSRIHKRFNKRSRKRNSKWSTSVSSRIKPVHIVHPRDTHMCDAGSNTTVCVAGM
jgi:hypothetical protein